MVGMTGFEPATSRPPDAHSNRTELHPVFRGAKVQLIFGLDKYTAHLVRHDDGPLYSLW